jgi:hypothetical protein
MPFEPEFMKRLTEFAADRGRLHSVTDWVAFQGKWFDRSAWPEKSASQRAAESPNKRGPVQIGGRTWGYTSWTYDLTPEARYEYFATLHSVGDPIRFPHEAGIAKTAANGWRQECPFDEISTKELGDESCPRCGRRLQYVRYSE